MDDGYQNEEYYNDNVSERISHTDEVHSELEPTKADSMILDQGYENAEPEYEYIGFSGIRMRRQPDNRGKAEPAPYTFEDDKWGPFVRKPISIFSLLLLCCLIMVKAAFVMTSVRFVRKWHTILRNWEMPDNIQLTDKYNYKTHCVVTSDEASKGKWNNIPCDKLHQSVCERDKEVTCVLQSPLSPH
nr:uncharacterized protein LOC118081487 isoform X2 [Zootoca vivipara]